MTPLEAARAAVLQALRPPPVEPVADWAERTIRLSAADSATPGRLRLWNHQRGILDALDDPDIERITVLKSARIGYTQLLSAIIGNYVANSPCPLLVLQPTTDDARDYAVSVESMFEASPDLRGSLAEDADPNGRSTMLAWRFPGGSVKFLAARSPRTLRRHTAKVLLMDEIDGFEMTSEGDPIRLAEMRTQTFPDRKILAGSTPVFDHGPISRLYAESDQRVFEVPCPECGDFHELQWRDLKWDSGKPETVKWVCPTCGSLVPERLKSQMLARGRWRATRPDVRGHAGFKFNSLGSPHFNARWEKLVAEFLVAKRDPSTLQVFTNTILGEPWRTEGEDLDEHELFGRREPFTLDRLPPEVLILTCGVDCQDDRLECVTMGHDRDGAIYVLGHSVFWGPIDGNTVWEELDAHLKATWKHPNGGQIRIDAAVVDSGDGGHSDLVHAFTRPRFGRRVVSGKGAAGFSRKFLERSSSKSAPLWLVGVDAVKSQLFARLARGTGTRFSEALEGVYFEQLTSERRVVRYSRGTPQARFERIPGKRAETLDATVYAWAARSLVGVNLDRREADLSSAASLKPKPKVQRSSWLEGRSRRSV